MPPTANSTSGYTSVCAMPGQQALALLGAAGHRGGLRGERADLVRGLGDQQHADERQHQDRALDEQGGPVHGDRAHPRRCGPGCRGRRSSSRRPPRSSARSAAARPPRDSTRWIGAARRPGHERLDQDPDDGHRRTPAASARAGRTRCAARRSSGRPRPGSRSRGTPLRGCGRSRLAWKWRPRYRLGPGVRRHRVGGVHLDQGLVDRGVDDVEDRLGVHAEHDDRARSAGRPPTARAPSGRACPRPPRAPARSSCAGTSTGCRSRPG